MDAPRREPAQPREVTRSDGAAAARWDQAGAARAYRRRAEAREASRVERFEALRAKAVRVAGALHVTFGSRARVSLFGSLLDLDRFHGLSDIDLAVEGLTPSEYWKAWDVVETVAGSTSIDLVRLETADPGLREAVRYHGQLLK